jgi:putative sterol carrier protein
MVGEVLYLALGQPAPAEQDKEADVSEGAGPGLDEIFQGMQSAFQPDKASGVDATIQWLIKDGDEEQPYALTIKDGQFSWEQGQAENPSVTLSTDRDSFTALMTGKAQGPALYMSGKLRIQGDLMLAQRMGSFFAQS